MPRKKTAEHFVDVAVMAALRRPLTYRLPAGLEVRLGQRVQVPLGTRRATGIVLEPAPRLAPGVKVRDVARVLDAEPVLSPELVTLGLWIAEYYVAPVGEVFRAMLPLRAETRRARLVALTELGRQRLEELDANLLEEVRTSAEAALFRYLAERQSAEPDGVPLVSVRQKLGASAPEMIQKARRQGLVTVVEVERERGRRKTWAVRLTGEEDGAATPAVHGPVPVRPVKLSPVARRIVEALHELGPVDDHTELLKTARANLATLRKLGQAGVVALDETRPGLDASAARASFLRSSDISQRDIFQPPELTPAQAAVFEDLVARLDRREFSVVLLHGVTASGKTEIYLRLIAECVKRGRTALVLVPEISLTPAMQSQFLARFGGQVALLHSGLAESERHEEWWRVRRGEARVVVGTRSSVFAPVEELGVVIVDEEHDASYKQGETPRYHGRDVAVVRARLAQALAVLGSATPSLESYSNAREGKYHLVKLEERIGGRPLASVEILDMREEFRQTHVQVPISRRLKEEIETQLQSRAQTMILLNRRGYSWFLLCRSCGQTQRCVNCSISLTYHRREHRLVCHYCGYTAPVPARCPNCASEYLYYVGEGTEKIESKFQEMFPGARVGRLDRDAARRPAHYRKLLSDFREGKIDILVGTQLIAKGHDFPGVTLVGVVSADQGLGLPDFRAAERTFQLLTQAAGRAGRGEAAGRVLVQTFYPEHYAIRFAAEQNYEGFFAKEIIFRRVMHYPPAAALANVIAQDKELEKAARIASGIGKFLSRLTGAKEARGDSDEAEAPEPDRQTGFATGIRIMGPAPAPLARIEGRYRIQFLLKSKSRARLNELLRRLVDYCEESGIPPQAVMIDMDPVNIM